jgi:hypothetical protein
MGCHRRVLAEENPSRAKPGFIILMETAVLSGNLLLFVPS